jgi:hypothetical protein
MRESQYTPAASFGISFSFPRATEAFATDREAYMSRSVSLLSSVLTGFLLAGTLAAPVALADAPGKGEAKPAAKPAVDEEYTRKIREYTTAPYFTSPLVDYLPASKTVPTPKAVLGDVAGAPGILPYSNEVY